MNHCFPNFDEMEDDCAFPIPSGFSKPKKPAISDGEEIMELLWQNGQVVVHRSSKKSTPFVDDAVIPAEQPVVREIPTTGAEEQQHLFMQEDEIASWLHYPLDDSSFYADLFYSAPPTTTVARAVAEIRPPPVPRPRPPIPPPPGSSPRLQNFVHFSRLPSKPISKPLVTVAGELTVVESNETPMVRPDSRDSHTAEECRTQVNIESVATAAATRELAAAVTCDLTAASSPSGSGASFSASAKPRPPTPKQDPPADDRKRKGRETDDIECRSEDIGFEAAEAKKQARGSASTKRCRAAEVHNQSERRRRDRINEKMRALQELIPRCNKSDKASMLDEAIEYIKSLQLQVQTMMAMGCGMVPMMYPSMQQYMPAMAMGMGMGMDMGLKRPMAPYPSMLPVPGSAMPNPAVPHLGPRFPIPPFHLPQVPAHDPSRIQTSNHHDPMLNSLVVHNANHPPMQNFVDPYQQFLGFHQPRLPLPPQNQAVVQQNTKPSTSKEVGNAENKQSGRK